MSSGDETRYRKLDHIRITVDSSVEHIRTTMLEYVELIHSSAPEASLDDVKLGVRFLGKELNAPLMVAGMTGGHEAAAKINCAIGEAVEELGLAMGVGSQRAAIENPSLAWTFREARRCAPTAPIVANLGAPQLVKGYGVREVVRAIEMVDADAIAIHLNPAQEAFQPEGDHDFRGVLDAVERLVEELDRPVIVKETGHGMSYEVVYLFYSRGVRYFDVSGVGGTSWVRVEMYRARNRGVEDYHVLAEEMGSWGIPTAASVVEARWAAPTACIIASGGVWESVDAAKAIALGADLAALALPVIRAYAGGGAAGVKRLLSRLVEGLRIVVFLTGSRSIDELRSKPIVVYGLLRGWVESRGIPLDQYLDVRHGLSHRC